MKYGVYALCLVFNFGCATIVKSPNQTVKIVGGPTDGTAEVQSPVGNYKLTGGETSISLPRTKDDISITVQCNNEAHKTVIPTHFDVGWGGFGNLIFGGIIGWVIDGVGDKGYDAKPVFSIAPYCQDRSTASK